MVGIQKPSPVQPWGLPDNWSTKALRRRVPYVSFGWGALGTGSNALARLVVNALPWASPSSHGSFEGQRRQVSAARLRLPYVARIEFFGLWRSLVILRIELIGTETIIVFANAWRLVKSGSPFHLSPLDIRSPIALSAANILYAAILAFSTLVRSAF
jgi:hypothetical protein